MPKASMPAPKTSKRGSAPVETTPQTTRERILQASIELFNHHGIRHVAIDHIAAKLGISNGNLNYHFRRKQDLIRATLEILQAQMRIALTPTLSAHIPRHGAEDLIRIMRTFWGFRFFFNALTDLVSKDEVLRREYFQFQEWALDTVDQGLRELVRKGEFRPVRAPNTTRLLAENMWSQWLNWLRLQQINSPSASIPEGLAMYDCALHHWSLLEPYFPEKFAKGLLPVYRKLLLSPDRA